MASKQKPKNGHKKTSKKQPKSEFQTYLEGIAKRERKEIDKERHLRLEQQWDEYFMKIACLTALRSKDPRTAVGACIADTSNHEVVGIGYNSMPYIKGEDNDEVFTWEGSSNGKDKGLSFKLKDPYVVHAAVNAVTNRTREFLTGCTIYLTLHPDCDCAHAIIRSGIKSIKYCMISRKPPSEMDKAQILLKRCKDIKLYPMCSTTLKNDFVDKLRRRNFEGEGTEVRKTAYQEYLPWESFFMQMAQLCEKRPGLDKDRSQIQGACIVSPDKQVISIGASGLPEDMNMEDFRSDNYEEGKNFDKTDVHVRHAEYRAILGGPSVKGCTLYVTKYPCHKCAQVIVQSGITEVVYEKEGTKDDEKLPQKAASYKSSEFILTKCLGEDKIRKYEKKEVPPLSQLALQEIYKQPPSYYSIAFTLCVLVVIFILYNRSPD